MDELAESFEVPKETKIVVLPCSWREYILNGLPAEAVEADRKALEEMGRIYAERFNRRIERLVTEICGDIDRQPLTMTFPWR